MGLAALLDECWTVEQRKACIRQLATNAATGDMEAVKLLMSYTFGKPRESVDLTSDGEVVLKVIYGNDGADN